MGQTGPDQSQATEASSRRASVTASIVSTARGIGLSEAYRDAFALNLATGWSARLLRSFERDSRRVRLARTAIRAFSLGLVDHNTVRMLVIDEYLRQWAVQGVTQVVILGAGLDSRCWRLRELEQLAFFEVDHASSQRVKRDRVSMLPSEAVPPPNPQVEYVAVDFEADSLTERLPGQGFDPRQATAWVCEGVTPYLTPQSIARLFRGIGDLSAPGSRLALSYVTPPDNAATTTTKTVVGRLLAKLGERTPGFVSSETLAALCQASGLTLLEDLEWREWQALAGARSRLPNLLKERLLIAECAG